MMQKFTFNRKKDIMIPETNNFSALKDKDGKVLDGDEVIKRFANIAVKYETTYNRPVPIANQKFIAWLKQAKRMLDNGETSEMIFQKTLIQEL